MVLRVEMSDFLVVNLTQCRAILVVKLTGTYRKILMAVKGLWVGERNIEFCGRNDEYIEKQQE